MSPFLAMHNSADGTVGHMKLVGQYPYPGQAMPMQKANSSNLRILQACPMMTLSLGVFTEAAPTLGDHIPRVLRSRTEELVLVSKARGFIARVQHVHPVGDRAMPQLPSEAVGVALFAANTEAAIAIGICRASPDQAVARVGDIRPQTLSNVGLGTIVALNKAEGLAFDPAPVRPVPLSESGLLPATAVTQAVGDARIGEHAESPFGVPRPRMFRASRGHLLALHYSTNVPVASGYR